MLNQDDRKWGVSECLHGKGNWWGFNLKGVSIKKNHVKKLSEQGFTVKNKQMAVIIFLTLVVLSWKSGAPSSDINHLFICFYLLSLLTQKDSPQHCRSCICLQDVLVLISVWAVAWLFCNSTASADLDYDGWVKARTLQLCHFNIQPSKQKKPQF